MQPWNKERLRYIKQNSSKAINRYDYEEDIIIRVVINSL